MKIYIFVKKSRNYRLKNFIYNIILFREKWASHEGSKQSARRI